MYGGWVELRAAAVHTKFCGSYKEACWYVHLLLREPASALVLLTITHKERER